MADLLDDLNKRYTGHLDAGGTLEEWFAPTLRAANEALRADLKAVVVAAQEIQKWHGGRGVAISGPWYDLQKALDRPGVKDASERD